VAWRGTLQIARGIVRSIARGLPPFGIWSDRFNTSPPPQWQGSLGLWEKYNVSNWKKIGNIPISLVAFTEEPCSRGKENRVRLPFAFGFGMVRRISKKGFLKKWRKKTIAFLIWLLAFDRTRTHPFEVGRGGGRGYKRDGGGRKPKSLPAMEWRIRGPQNAPRTRNRGSTPADPRDDGVRTDGFGVEESDRLMTLSSPVSCVTQSHRGRKNYHSPPPLLIAPTSSPFGSPGFPGRGLIRGVLDRLVENPRGKKLI